MINKNSSNKSMITRCLIVLGVIIFLMFGADIFSLVNLQIINSEQYKQKAQQQQLRDTQVSAHRGSIYDTNMKVLAQSATVWKIYIVPSKLKNSPEKKELVASTLSEILDIDKNEILEKCELSNSYEVIKTKVENPDKEKIDDFIKENKLTVYLGANEDSKRYYPYDDFAASLLGFTGTDDQGLNGLEIKYEDELSGTPGRVVTAKNAKNGAMPNEFETAIEPKQGNSLVLTIDEVIQYYLEKYMEQAVIDNDAKSATAIVMDIETGAILGMSTKPDFNPNSPFTINDVDLMARINALSDDEKSTALANARNEQWKNLAVSYTYEPGSVFKIITAAAALEEDKVAVDDHFFCKGYVNVAGNTIRCSHREGHGDEDLIEGMQNSCNPVFIEIAQRLGEEDFYKYFDAFGFAEKTDIDLPGEMNSIYMNGDNWNISTISSYSFGQTFQISPIQMITAISAIANGGTLMKPYVVEQVIDEEMNIVEKFEPVEKRQVVSTETAETVKMLMEAVTSGGTGKNAYAAGYRVAGKTGTSQKIASRDDGDDEEKWIASFGGFAPADDPKIALLVIVDEPKAGSYYGGTVAAPIASSLFTEILSYLNVEPIYTDEELNDIAIQMPNVVGQSVEKAKDTLSNSDLTYKIVGDGEKVLSQSPAMGLAVPKGGIVVVYTEENPEKKMVSVPDFSNKTVSQVMEMAKNLGLNARLSGTQLDQSGVWAYSQDVEAETNVEQGTVITVMFQHANDVAD